MDKTTTDTVGRELPERVEIAMGDIAHTLRDGLMAFSSAAGLEIMRAILEVNTTDVAGPKGKHDPDRQAYRHGYETATVTMGGQRVRVRKPRVRSLDGEEVSLPSWEVFQQADPLSSVIFERLIAGISTRRYQQCTEPLGDVETTGTSKSAISRRFIEHTRTALEELMHQDLSDIQLAVIMIDGVEFAGQMCVCALGITTDGVKIPLGVWQGDTENTIVCKALVSDLVARNLTIDDGILAVIDGAKALRKALKDVFGDGVVIQRCQLHKQRNVLGHLPKIDHQWVQARMRNAYNTADFATALKKLKDLASHLETHNPSAAGSLREGLSETLTINRFIPTGTALHKTLRSTNPIESMMDIIRTTTRNVKHWQPGDMRLRWTATGMLDAQRSFKRVKGYRAIPQLTKNLKQHLQKTDTNITARKAA